jgi:hypothetical protein
MPLTAGGMNNRMEIVKKVMKEQGLSLGPASKFVKENNLYQKIGKVLKSVGAGNKSGKINRLKKAKRWTEFSKGVVNDGFELGQKGLDMYNKQMDRSSPLGQVKKLFGGEQIGGVNRLKKAKRWTEFSKGVVNDGLELGQKGLNMYNKQKDRSSPLGQVKKLFGGKRGPSKWIEYVKEYSSKHNISYKQALSQAGPSYKALK